MQARTIRLGLHSFSFDHHFRHAAGFDVFALIDTAVRLGFSGLHISMNDENYRWIGGTESERLRAVGAAVRRHGLYLEIDTSGTEPGHLAKLMRACRALGADRLRTYTRHRGRPREVVAATIGDLRAAAPVAADLGIVILLENHEDFTGREIGEILAAVDHPSVGALYDFGNAMMVMEDPLEAAREMAPFVRSAHLKDHVVVVPPRGDGKDDGGDAPAAPVVCGAPIGRGRIDIAGILGHLLATSPLEHVCLQNVYGYTAPIARRLDRFDEVRARRSAFAPLDPPFDDAVCLLDPAALAVADLDRLLNYEFAAVALGAGKIREILADLGLTPDGEARGVYANPSGDDVFR